MLRLSLEMLEPLIFRLCPIELAGAYPSDVHDDERVLVAQCLALLQDTAGQRHHDLQEVFNSSR